MWAHERIAAAHEAAALCAVANELSRFDRKEAIEEALAGATRAWLVAASDYESSDEDYRDPGYEVGSGTARPSGSGVDGGSVAYAAQRLLRFVHVCAELQLPALGAAIAEPAGQLFDKLSESETNKGNDEAAQKVTSNSKQCHELASRLQKEAEAESEGEWQGGFVEHTPPPPLFWCRTKQHWTGQMRSEMRTDVAPFFTDVA